MYWTGIRNWKMQQSISILSKLECFCRSPVEVKLGEFLLNMQKISIVWWKVYLRSEDLWIFPLNLITAIEHGQSCTSCIHMYVVFESISGMQIPLPSSKDFSNSIISILLMNYSFLDRILQKAPDEVQATSDNSLTCFTQTHYPSFYSKHNNNFHISERWCTRFTSKRGHSQMAHRHQVPLPTHCSLWRHAEG